uniref:FLYWCH-type domain-containing protein n=1 Tax=Daphnia galeata TaxID=27404 RepID=A0A8J2WGV3_9CRUS|nr:unnamed protein product [Daphnia galeata]
MRWKLVYKAGKKLSNILVDRKYGYKFGVWKVLSNGILYRCNHRPQLNPCKCTVLQSGSMQSSSEEFTLIPAQNKQISMSR